MSMYPSALVGNATHSPHRCTAAAATSAGERSHATKMLRSKVCSGPLGSCTSWLQVNDYCTAQTFAALQTAIFSPSMYSTTM